jgi:hypothetical protein
MGHGHAMTKHELYLKAIELDLKLCSGLCKFSKYTSARGLYSVAWSGNDDTRALSQSIELDPNCALAYVNLANTLPQDGSIQLHGHAMTTQGLCLKSY